MMIKPHLQREMVNELRDCAIQYHDHQSLRDRLSRIVLKYLNLNDS